MLQRKEMKCNKLHDMNPNAQLCYNESLNKQEILLINANHEFNGSFLATYCYGCYYCYFVAFY